MRVIKETKEEFVRRIVRDEVSSITSELSYRTLVLSQENQDLKGEVKFLSNMLISNKKRKR